MLGRYSNTEQTNKNKIATLNWKTKLANITCKIKHALLETLFGEKTQTDRITEVNRLAKIRFPNVALTHVSQSGSSWLISHMFEPSTGAV